MDVGRKQSACCDLAVDPRSFKNHHGAGLRPAVHFVLENRMNGPVSPIRTVRIESPSARAETLAVLRTAAAVVFLAYFAIGLRRGDAGAGGDSARSGGTAPSDLMPFQVLFRDQDPASQRLFRTLQEGLAEIEIRRASSKAWPEVTALAAEGIPPFAPDPQDRGAIAWTLRRKSYVVNYLGAPVPGSGRRPWLLLFEEPQPDNPDVSHRQLVVLDEEHRRLSDGTILHVSVWIGPDGAAAGEDVLFRPLLIKTGWKQVLVGKVPGR